SDGRRPARDEDPHLRPPFAVPGHDERPPDAVTHVGCHAETPFVVKMEAMDETQAFAEERPRLTSLAYRMLGSVAEAEDVVQDAFVRLHAALAGGEAIESMPAFLTTVTTRIA